MYCTGCDREVLETTRICPECGGREFTPGPLPVPEALLREDAGAAVEREFAGDIKCPKCGYPTLKSSNSKLTVDVCPACKGALVQRDQLAGVVEDAGALQLAPVVDATGKAKVSGKHKACGGTFLTHQLNPGCDLNVDVCDSCGVVWFDAGELHHASHMHEVLAAKGEINKALRWFHWIFQLLTSLPVEFNAKPRRLPFAVYALIVVNVLVFIAQLSFGDKFDPSIIPASAKDIAWGGSLISSMFAHGGLLHIVANMYMLYIFGDNVEDVLGRTWFLIFYLLSGILATLFHAALTTEPGLPLVGASGAIAAVMGAYLVYFKSAKLSLVYVFWNPKLSPWVFIGLWFVTNIVGVYLEPDSMMAYWAHIGGFVVGFTVAYLTRAEVIKRNPYLMYL